MSDRQLPYYDIDGIRYVRVTAALSAINRPGLNKWLGNVGTAEAERIVSEAQDIGTETHKFIQRIISGGSVSKPEWDILAPEIQSALQAWMSFKENLKPKIKATELQLVSKKYGYAGKTDAVALVNGELEILDWKTAGQLWEEVELQMAAYAMAFFEMTGEKPVRCRAIRLDKTVKYWTKSDQVVLTNIDDAFKAFLAALTLYNYKSVKEG